MSSWLLAWGAGSDSGRLIVFGLWLGIHALGCTIVPGLRDEWLVSSSTRSPSSSQISTAPVTTASSAAAVQSSAAAIVSVSKAPLADDPSQSVANETSLPDSSGPIRPAEPSSIRSTKVELDPSAAERLSAWLEQEAWQVDLRYVVWDPQVIKRWRYTFLPTNPAIAAEDELARRLFRDHVSVETDETLWETALDQTLATWASSTETRGWNACIFRVRWQVQHGRQPRELTLLEQLVRDPPTGMSLATRCAAAEAWGRAWLLHPEPWESWLPQVQSLLQRPGLPEELRGTLWRTLSLRVPPLELAGLETAVSTGAPAVRRAAVESFLLHAWGMPEARLQARHWPASLAPLAYDPDPMMRRLWCVWTALCQPQTAISGLKQALRDIDPVVQEQAIHALGWLDDPQAREALEEVLHGDNERLRVLALHSLPSDLELLRQFAKDRSPRVRVAVAQGLKCFPVPAACKILRDYLQDESLEVQQTALAATHDWPEELARCLWLEALQHASLRVRQQALTWLKERTVVPEDFPLHGSPAERQHYVQNWAADQGWSLLLPLDHRTRDVDHAGALQALLRCARGWCDAWHQQQDTSPWEQELLELARPEYLTDLETEFYTAGLEAPSEGLLACLSHLSPLYRILRTMQSTEVGQRRQAARELQRLSSEYPLSPLLIRWIASHLQHESDYSVWQACLQALQHDPHPEVYSIIQLGLHHTWPDIRRLAVSYLQEHPVPEAGVWLLPLFRDPTQSVRLAAITAAGLCGHPLVLEGVSATEEQSAYEGLRALLPRAQHEEKWAILEAMARLHDQVAEEELRRLSFDPQPAIRSRVAAVIGVSGWERLGDVLMRLAWADRDRGVQAQAVRSLEQLFAPLPDPWGTELAAASAIRDKINIWAAWWSATHAADVVFHP